MKLPKNDVQALIDGMLPQLRLTTSRRQFMEQMSGHTLINVHGITKDIKGNQVKPGQKYDAFVEKPVPVDHADAIREIIKKAKTINQMQDKLAAYLLENATDEVLQAAAESLSKTQK
jgi:hypothetical protein